MPAAHRAKISSTNPIERVNSGIKRRWDVAGISRKRGAFAAGLNEAAIRRLVGALLLEQQNEWAVQRHSMSLETMAPISDDSTVKLPAAAA